MTPRTWEWLLNETARGQIVAIQFLKLDGSKRIALITKLPKEQFRAGSEPKEGVFWDIETQRPITIKKDKPFEIFGRWEPLAQQVVSPSIPTLLQCAADKITKQTWRQGQLSDLFGDPWEVFLLGLRPDPPLPDQRYCVLGHLYMCGLYPGGNFERQINNLYTRTKGVNDPPSIVGYNDAIARTPTQVKARLTKMRKLALTDATKAEANPQP